jgi:hypothetical protein
MDLANIKPILANCCQTVADSPVWHKLAEGAVSGGFTLVGISIAAYLAYRFAIRQKRMETFIGLEQLKYQRKLVALEGCWKLIAYTTDTENEKSIITWEQLKGKEKAYCLNVPNAKGFINELANFNYGSGLGIYLSKAVKEQLFEYRSMVYGFLLKEKDNQSNTIKIEKTELAAKMISIHQALVTQLKAETDKIDKIGMGK